MPMDETLALAAIDFWRAAACAVKAPVFRGAGLAILDGAVEDFFQGFVRPARRECSPAVLYGPPRTTSWETLFKGLRSGIAICGSRYRRLRKSCQVQRNS